MSTFKVTIDLPDETLIDAAAQEIAVQLDAVAHTDDAVGDLIGREGVTIGWLSRGFWRTYATSLPVEGEEEEE